MAKKTETLDKKTKKELNKHIKAQYKKRPILVISIIALIALGVAGYYLYFYVFKKEPEPQPILGEFSIHVMELGNDLSGDSIYIKAGENDILVDGGSSGSSTETICNYVKTYCTDNVLEYVIVTHAHKDHYAAFTTENSVFDTFECATIIDFPLTEQTGTALYETYISKRNNEIAEGAKHYNALECYREINGAKKFYELGNNIRLEILYNYFYENDASSENDYSVCFRIWHGDRQFLFTGDLESEGEKKLIENNDLSAVDFYKAGHHGSAGSSTKNFLNLIRPKICVVSCVAGDKYKFPTQSFIDRISLYTEQVYVTSQKTDTGAGYISMCGTIIVESGSDGISVNGKEQTIKLKDTEWFKTNRETPIKWAE